MLNYPQIDPVAFSVGPLTVYWYGLMYLAGFLLGGLLGLVRAGRPDSGWTAQQVWDLVFYVALGVVLGGRLGYALFYNAAHYVCLLYTSPSPRDLSTARMPSSA